VGERYTEDDVAEELRNALGDDLIAAVDDEILMKKHFPCLACPI
jgi:hypothetical protein